MTEEQYDGMHVVDAQTGQLRYRIRDSRIVDAHTEQLAFRIRAGDQVVDAATGQLVFRIRDGIRLVDANSGTLQFCLRGGVDTSFEFHSDSAGKDSDRYSPTLLRYHQLLWSKELPTGGRFDLAPERRHLVHRSSRGVFLLSSDAFTTRLGKKAGRVIREIPDEEMPEDLGYTVGSAIVFPGNRVGRKQTINGARGFRANIADRPDLTLECIRRHYLGVLPNPLADVLLRYKDFFDLFGDFRRYVEFFLLQDLVEDDGQTIRFFHPFADFRTPAVPKNKAEYLSYLQASNGFIRARNRRIDADESGRDLEGRQP